MEITDLRYFAASAEYGAYGAAARVLGLQPSTLSRRIARLEDELGLSLFEKGGFGLRLTAGGRAILAETHRTLKDIADIARVGRSNGAGLTGEIRLGVRMPPVGEPFRGHLASWRLSHPDVRLTVHELDDHVLCTAVHDRRVDLVLVPQHALWSGAASELICNERLFVALPCDHPRSTDEVTTWEGIRRDRFLVQDWEDSHVTSEFYRARIGDGVELSCHPASKESLLALIAAGFGVTLVTAGQAQIAYPGIVFRPIGERDAIVSVMLAWAPDREEAIVGRFVAFMRERVKSLPLCQPVSAGTHITFT